MVRGGRITLALPTVDGGWLEQHNFELAQALESGAA